MVCMPKVGLPPLLGPGRPPACPLPALICPLYSLPNPPAQARLTNLPAWGGAEAGISLCRPVHVLRSEQSVQTFLMAHLWPSWASVRGLRWPERVAFPGKRLRDTAVLIRLRPKADSSPHSAGQNLLQVFFTRSGKGSANQKTCLPSNTHRLPHAEERGD